jgi:murein DD-endopeptidase MepM/ murein hydrolase activator NlpD
LVHYSEAVLRARPSQVPAVAVGLLLAVSILPAAAGSLTLPFAQAHPEITAWMDHHYPTRQADGIMIRYDGQTGWPYDGHRGTDFAVAANTPVVAADDGIVSYAEWSDTGGWGVVIEHASNRTAYFHNNVLYVYPTQRVSRGQLIALSGSTGNSTGPHLHFEVRDLLPFWHAIDPFGWSGSGKDPWKFNHGYLWTTDPPSPFVLPLVFVEGARWNAWYGLAAAPPSITWRTQEGPGGFAGLRMAWDQDPGGPAPGPGTGRTGTTEVPGPGQHTLHLRVFDRAGLTADVTYLYLYDRERPSIRAAGRLGSAALPALSWLASDPAGSGPAGFRGEVRVDGGAWRPWFTRLPAKGVPLLVDESAAGTSATPETIRGEALLVALPGHRYAVRSAALNRAGNASEPLEQELAPAATGPPSPADAVTIALPNSPRPGAPGWSLARAEVRAPSGRGAYLLDAWGGILALGGAPPLVSPRYEPGVEWAVDLLLQPWGGYILGVDGQLAPLAGTPALSSVALSEGRPAVRGAHLSAGVLVVDESGKFAVAGPAGEGVPPAVLASPLGLGSVVVDMAALGDGSGIVLDSAGEVHAFAPPGRVPPSIAAFPPRWPLAAPPRALAIC